MLTRFLFALALMLSAATAQQDPPIVRLDLLILRIDIGGSSPGIGLQPPRVGLDIWKVAGVSVGIEPDPPPPPPAVPPINTFAELEEQLAQVLAQLNQLIQSGASPQAIAEKMAEAERIAAHKHVLGPIIAAGL